MTLGAAPAQPTRLSDLPDEVVAAVESGEMESREAEEILAWAIERFHPRLALSASFGAPEGMALLDMMHRIEPSSRVFVLDTGRLQACGPPAEVLDDDLVATVFGVRVERITAADGSPTLVFHRRRE